MLKFFILYLVTISLYANHLVNISSPELYLLKQAKRINSLSPQKKITLIIQLKLRNEDQLKQLVQEIYDPNSSNYQKFLTKEDYDELFAPTREIEEKVAQFFSSQGMQTEINDHLIHVIGKVEQIERSLNLKLNDYQYKGEIFYAHEKPIQMNQDVGQYITAILGLNNLPVYNNNITKEQRTQKLDFRPEALPTNTSILNGFSGMNLQKTYNLQNIPKINGTVIDGSGQTLVVVDICGSNTKENIISDANSYFSGNNIPPFILDGPQKNFAIINPDGTPFTTCPGSPSFSNEINLDIQASHTLAPGDNTVLVLGTNQKSTLTAVINTLVNRNFTIAGFSNAYVISNSWSGPEVSVDTSLESTLLIAAARGISVNFSSGDCGDNTYTDNGKCTSVTGAPVVNYPSSSAYVTAIGASAVFVDANYNYSFETVWGSIYSTGGGYNFGGGTGGGVSQYYGPVNWQSSIRNFSAGGYGLIKDKGYKRALPDITMLGDPQTGLNIISNGTTDKDGGTSLACPLFSATLVLVNQARLLLNKATPIGQAAPYLYQQNQRLLLNKALNVIMPPTQIISGATSPPVSVIDAIPVPASAFSVSSHTFGWDSSLTIEPESQFWNDAVGVGSPNIPHFVMEMANM